MDEGDTAHNKKLYRTTLNFQQLEF